MKAARRPLLCFGLAVLIGAAAVGPPLDRLADASFAWHMVQHLVLLYGVALLLLLASPFDLLTRFLGKRATADFVRVTRPLHVVGLPPVALGIFIAVMWLTHYSGLYELALKDWQAHVAEHVLYLVAGIAFWLPVIAPHPLRPPKYPVRMLYLALALPQGALLGMAIESARAPLYEHYAVVAGAAAALADQRDAAAVMWILGGLVIFGAFLLTLAAWARRETAAA